MHSQSQFAAAWHTSGRGDHEPLSLAWAVLASHCSALQCCHCVDGHWRVDNDRSFHLGCEDGGCCDRGGGFAGFAGFLQLAGVS